MGRIPVPDSRRATLLPIRHKAMRVCAILLILTSAGLASASAQSLADVARKETERRQGVKDVGGKTWTNQDLKTVAAAPVETAAPDANATAVPGAEADAPPSAADAKASPKPEGSAKSDEKAEVKDQAYWAKRMSDLKEQLERDETFREALQNRIDSLTSDFVNRDDPAQRTQIADSRQKALSELDRVKKAIEQGKRAIPELEEEARRDGVPAGWLR